MDKRPDVEQRWIQQLRRTNKTTLSWACIYCDDRRIFTTADSLWEHALSIHQPNLPPEGGQEALENFRKSYEAESALKRPTKDDSQPRKPVLNEANRVQPEPPPGQAQSKRPLSTPVPFKPTRTLSALGTLNLGTPRGSDDVTMQDVSEDEGQTPDQPRKRVAIGDGVSAGSGSPLRDQSASPQPRRSKARPNSAPLASGSEDFRRQDHFDSSRPNTGKRTLWTPEQGAPLTKSSFDASNIASIQAQKNRAQGHRHQTKTGKQLQTSSMALNPRAPNQSMFPNDPSQEIFSNRMQPSLPKDENYNMILQPETRPISQEQLVAEVKGIYAGLVIVEAKCIEVDNKQATLAQTDSGPHQKLNNEQWQALIALHRTLLHEHHDFFLASQHPSASAALRRLASKYAMPARMWRHGIHSFLELLRHRLPASLDHMLAFIFLAYSMMALLYETVPAFEDTWIECLGDLGRYRMAIEDDDIRDREVWTGVARHWYSKASDKAPTTGRLYHHLAILARPNALQQLFYYSKSLCVAVPFTSARESILTLFEPVFNSNSQGQYRLPPFDSTFVKAHGLLFTGRNIESFEQTVNEFLNLLDNQIGRVTRKFMEQGYHIAVANSVAMLGFASKENVLMLAISKEQENVDVEMTVPSVDDSAAMVSFNRAALLANKCLEIVLQRIGDPNVLPFIHVTLVYMLYVSSHPGAMSLVQVDFPWELLSLMLNTLLGAYHTPARIEDNQFPLPEKDEFRPFPEDYAIRGLLWVENYFPTEWFNNEKIDEEEKYREVASMTEQRKERILWLACMIAKRGSWIKYSRTGFSIPSPEACSTAEIPGIESRTLTSGSETTQGSFDRAATWKTVDTNEEDNSDIEKDLASSATPATDIPAQP